MKLSILAAVALAGLFLGPAAYAQQASAPAGSTGQCKDGSYSSAASKRGACRGHKGVKQWYAASAAPASKAPMAAAPPAMTPAPEAKPASHSTMQSKPAMPAPAANAATGGGAGMVWVNGKVYHCSTDKWYGKTKHGEYMSEPAAKAKGAHPEHGKVCTP